MNTHISNIDLLNKCIDGMEQVFSLHNEGKKEEATALAFQLHTDASEILGGPVEVRDLIDAFHITFARYWKLSHTKSE